MNIVGFCENIRKEASEMAGVNYAYNLKRKTGALDFITSPENNPDPVDPQLLSWDSGKKIGTLLIHYDQRTKVCEINDHEGNTICNSGSTPRRKSVTKNINRYVNTPVRRYTNEEMVVLCKDTKQFIRERVFGSDIRAAHEKMDEMILADLTSMTGKNYGWSGTTTSAGSSRTVQLLDNGTDQKIPLPGNYAEMILDYQNNQLNGTPALIGQGNLQMFYTLQKMSCCNSATPYGDADMSGDARFYLDQAANTILGTNQFLMLAPGIVKFVPFNENRNINQDFGSAMHTVIPDPMGYPFDWNLDFKWDECTKSWVYMLSVHWTVFNVYQSDSFANDGEDTSPDMSPDCNDELRGMMGVFQYNGTVG